MNAPTAARTDATVCPWIFSIMDSRLSTPTSMTTKRNSIITAPV